MCCRASPGDAMTESFARTALTLTGALLAWAADFVFVYAFAAVACERGYAQKTVAGLGIVPFAAIAATLAAAGVTIWLLRAAVRGHRATQGCRGFESNTALAVGALAMIAIALTALPALLVRGVCA
jgi:hypothetical protein